MFESLQPAPPDAILGLGEAFKQDPNPRKINLSVGVYQDADGRTPVLDCVKQAERRMVDGETTKSYPKLRSCATRPPYFAGNFNFWGASLHYKSNLQLSARVSRD
jgi:aspartate/tyrosine/aromatic aminotransferase